MDFVDQLKSSVDIVGTIGEYVRLKQARGSSRYTGLCPFHNEKTPSFSVHAGHQFYYCFGCQAKGDVLKFIMEIENVSFYEALKLLADRNGLAMPRRDYSDPDAKLRAAMFEMHEIAAELFRANLRCAAGQEARRYLETRGIEVAQAQEFGLGFSDSSGQQLTRKLETHFPAEQLEASGLVLKRQDSAGYFDRFRGRLMFPIHNESGKVIGFGGRALRPGDEPKYLNSPETMLYRKSRTLYNLHRAKDAIRKQDFCVLVEGYMDAIGLYSAGIRNVVASCGTALTDAQVKSVKRHSDRIVVNFDPDAAGAKAAERSLEVLLDEGMRVRVLELNSELDPDEYLREFGSEAYAKEFARAPAYFTWLADRAKKKFDMRTIEGRLEAFRFVAPAIARIHDRLERFAVANDIGAYLGVDSRLVREQFSGGQRKKAGTNLGGEPSIPATERLLLNCLLVSSDARLHVIPQLTQISAIDRFVTREVFSTMFVLHRDHDTFRFSDLEARLSDTGKNLLSHVVFADEMIEERTALDIATSCLLKLRSLDPAAEIAELRARAQAAERNGDVQEALRLLAELDRRTRAC